MNNDKEMTVDDKAMEKKLCVYLCIGAPGSGKSTWAKEKIASDPDSFVRINNDDLRAMCNGSIYSPGYEKLIAETRSFLIREALKRNKSVIIDNVNANKSHWESTLKICRSMNKDIIVREVPFYLPVEELIARDSKREGTARVGEKIVRKFFNDLGRESFKDYVPREEVLHQNPDCKEGVFIPAAQNRSAKPAIISDLDGTVSIFVGKRSPYDAAKCADDNLNEPVAETIRLYAAAGHHTIFCSGREDKYRTETEQFLHKHLPGLEYTLLMRKSGDMRRDRIIKEELYRNEIEGKYWIKFVMDDRDQVVSLWRELGLTCFQVAPGNF